MKTRALILLANVITLTACGSATDVTGPDLPRVASSELQVQEVPGPKLSCRIEAGGLNCELTSEPGFRVQVLNVLIENDEQVDEIGFFGDQELAPLHNSLRVAAIESYPVDLDIQLHYIADAIEAPDGATQTEASVRCRVHVTDAASAGAIVCGAGLYERWNVYLVPDAEMADAWEARVFGSAKLRASVVSEAQTDALCFRDYPSCDASGLTERLSEIADEAGTVPDELRYVFTIPTDQADSTVSFSTNLSYDIATVDGPGIYVFHPNGVLSRAEPGE